MNSSGSQGWICPNCGLAASYREHHYKYCGRDRPQGDEPELISETTWRAPRLDAFITSLPNLQRRYIFLALT